MANYRQPADFYFLRMALLVSERGTCIRRKVGCILVKDNRIISQGYNGFISGHPHNSVIINDHEIATIHAEQNAIIDCAKRGVNCKGSTAYITHFPCVNCLKFIVQAGIVMIYYINDYKNELDVIEKLGIDIPIKQI